MDADYFERASNATIHVRSTSSCIPALHVLCLFPSFSSVVHTVLLILAWMATYRFPKWICLSGLPRSLQLEVYGARLRCMVLV